MKKLILLSLGLLLLIHPLKAQYHLGFSGQLGIPLHEFKDNTNAIGGGFRANLYIPFSPAAPVFFGIDFGYMVYGSNTQRINQNINVVAGNTVLTTIPVNLKVTTNNNLINTFGVLRIKAPLTIVQPYIDGLVGFNYFYTRTKVYDESTNHILTSNNNSSNKSNVVNARTELNSLVFAYGGGAGLMLKFGPNVKMDLRAIYLLGGEAKYYDSSQTKNWKVEFTGSGTFNPNNYNSNDIKVVSPDGTPKKSKTDLLSINVGLVIDF